MNYEGELSVIVFLINNSARSGYYYVWLREYYEFTRDILKTHFRDVELRWKI